MRIITAHTIWKFSYADMLFLKHWSHKALDMIQNDNISLISAYFGDHVVIIATAKVR